jgi:hypothetical protein
VCTGALRDCASEAGECQVNPTCNEVTQSCEFDDALTGTPCDDGLFCTENDQFSFGGICNSGAARDCSDRDAECFVGQCDETDDACVAVANIAAPCDDGNDCTGTVGVPDSCDAAGACQAGGSVIATTACEDGDPCTGPDTCDGAGTCDPGAAFADTDPCDDGNPCTTGTQCDALGVCGGGSFASTITSCDDGDTCSTLTRCNGAGACAVVSASIEGTLCSDGDETTGEDMCNATGMCVGVAD